MERKTINVGRDQQISCLVADHSDGRGELLLFCHGFPGLAFSWRHQLRYFARAGYVAVALDMRGYGDSSAPEDVADYSLDHIRHDLLAVLAHFGRSRAVFVGHDFGAPVVWNMALHEPESVVALVVLSVPYDFDYYGRRGLAPAQSTMPPTQQFSQVAQEHFLHAHYFQSPGVAERELDANCSRFLSRLFWSLSARGALLGSFASAPGTAGYLDVLPPAGMNLPWSWLSQADFAVYADMFSRTGFRGALNWYRVADINWQLNKRYVGQSIDVPVSFIAGSNDPVLTMSGEGALAFMAERVPGLEVRIVDGAGHWVQQEQAEEVNAEMRRFLQSVYSREKKNGR